MRCLQAGSHYPFFPLFFSMIPAVSFGRSEAKEGDSSDTLLPAIGFTENWTRRWRLLQTGLRRNY